ncbi:glycosyltransferase family 25 protein [Aestuariibacter sp. AA17]|uniref:Glycosyltransferase family 25 protein n=1 Tax=Fluctibacter corallii TaxID=2984329 RepID=A0ABT3AC19_9ALTE|nr:glycosyltransferase family 25 protein [Aestuariibacter sp. AA17]MCV2886160.1 glycosyltransferase family 25 protein [Aestuariibacter sp. AA17]
MAEQNAAIFSSLNDYFDHVYVLTLTHATDRQENVKKELAGLNWSFFYGTDKKTLDMQTLERDGIYDDAEHKSTKRTHRSMNLGEVACSLSHKRMYQDMLDNGYKRVLIMEDDVLPVPEQLARFNEIVKQLPNDWELLMLGYYGHKLAKPFYKAQVSLYTLFHHLSLFNWGNVSKNWIDNIIMDDYSEDLFEIGKVLGTHAYAITDEAAKKFIDYQTPVKLQADRIFNYYKSERPLKGFAVKRPVFTLSELSKVSYIQ